MTSPSVAFRAPGQSAADGRTLLESGANNLNALRLALAALVMFSHSFALSYGSEDSEPLKRLTRGQETCGTIAVNLFFLISGVLITASWFRSKSMSDFLLRRVLRIYPGFVVALTFSAVLTWVLCPGFWPNTGNVLKWARDFLTDAAFLGMKSLEWPGTFARNPWAGYANGSLWTIPEEFKCYILVAVIGLFCLFKRRVLILVSAGAVVALFARGLLRTPVSWGHLQVNHGEHLVSRFYSYFLAGMLIWLFRDKIRFSPGLAVVSLAGLLVAARFTPAFSLLFLPAGSYLALYMGLSKPWRFTRWTQKTDISYGVYLYAWPVQQFVAMHPGLRSAIVNLLVSVPATAILAWLSWHFVEHKCLRMKSVQLVDYDPAISHS